MEVKMRINNNSYTPTEPTDCSPINIIGTAAKIVE